jgi:hypothetical protein
MGGRMKIEVKVVWLIDEIWVIKIYTSGHVISISKNFKSRAAAMKVARSIVLKKPKKGAA